MSDWQSILHAVQVTLGGEQDRGRELLEACWSRTPPGEHAQRCVLAHYLADLQEDLDEEIRWDESALRDFQHVHDSDLAPLGIPSAAGLAPSLHLNLGDGYRRRGDLPGARRELDAGLSSLDALDHDGYGAMIRTGLQRLAEQLDAIETSGRADE